jgi:hypothetical protein
MATTQETIRDDERYVVTVGWLDELGTFFARVYARDFPRGEPLVEVGTKPGEVPTISALAEYVRGYATLPAEVVTDLRHAAAPLS